MPKNTYKTEWSFKGYYKSLSDPKIQIDLKEIISLCDAFSKKYSKNNDYLESTSKLYKAVSDYEKLQEKIGGAKPLAYLHLYKAINSSDQKAESLMNLCISKFTNAVNNIQFFELNIGKISNNNQKKFLVSTELKEFRYFLKKIFDTAKHNLSEAEEKIMSLKYLPAHEMWTSGNSKLVSKQIINWKGKNIPLSEATGLLPSLNYKDRGIMQDRVNDVLKSISFFSEQEINAIYTDKKINDELRGFSKPYSSTILSYQNEEKTVLALLKAVNEGFKISHKFYEVKAKMMGVKSLRYADRSAGIGSKKKEINFDQSINIVTRAFENVSKNYSDTFTNFLKEGRVDVFPRKGKRGGAFCSCGIGVPTVVMLNHVSGTRDVMTIAHEMGHAFHSELSKNQRVIYQDYTIASAEVASTFFENVAFEEIFEKLSDEEKVFALHDRIYDDIATIFRQIACFNYELEMHSTIREKGSLSAEEMALLHNKHMSTYLGKVIKLEEKDGYFFVQWPHLRYGFYVYTYAFGQLVSKALYARYRKDKKYIKEIEKFLSAGGSDSPENIFRSIGVDVSKPEFFIEGLKTIEEDIKNLEKLSKGLTKSKK